nr:IS5 family transposase [Pseudonocardia sp. HH130629-09]
MLSYPSGMTVSSRALHVLSDALRAHRNQRATRWRKLTCGRQALLVVAHLRKGETYTDLACGFRVGTSTVYRYLREAIELLAAMSLFQPDQRASASGDREGCSATALTRIRE